MRRAKHIDDAPMLFVCGMSRSGTTLLATIFDAHGEIAMGSELIPGPGLVLAEVCDALEHGLELASGDFAQAGAALRSAGRREHGLVLTRCARAGLSAQQTRDALAALRAEGLEQTGDFPDRMRMAWRLIRERGLAERAALFGFKLNTPALAASHAMFPNARFVSIVRDPRDVVASQRKRGFDRTTEEICKAWMTYTKAAEAMAAKHPDVASLTRYEVLVSEPQDELARIFDVLPVDLEESVFAFASSGSAVFRGHPNAEQLRRGFFDSSVGTWRETLTDGEAAQIESACGRRMAAYAAAA